MMRRVLSGAVLALVVSLVPAFAAEDDNRFALVIGNAAYEGEMALANPANDAGAMADTLAAIGWKVTKLLDGDRRAMNRVITQFRDALAGAKNPTAMLFYAGHGMQINGVNYLIPVKESFETPDDVVNDAVSLQTILNAFDDAKVSTNIVILDACRDNPFVKKNTRSLGGTRGLSVVQKSANVEGSAVLFATAPGDTAADGSGDNGVFTTALLKYITTDISLQVLAARVTGEVKRMTGGKQTPYSSLSLSDEFFIVPASMRTGAPATAAAVPVVTVQPTVVAAPKQDQNSIKASLIIEKQSLTIQRQEIQSKGAWSGVVGGIGWFAALLGGGMSGWGYYEGTQALAEYNSIAPGNQQGYDGARDKMDGANTKFTYGLYMAGGGFGLAVISLFLGPDTSKIDSQMREVDKKIVLLGGN